jgi:hypothetical protein
MKARTPEVMRSRRPRTRPSTCWNRLSPDWAHVHIWVEDTSLSLYLCDACDVKLNSKARRTVCHGQYGCRGLVVRDNIMAAC